MSFKRMASLKPCVYVHIDIMQSKELRSQNPDQCALVFVVVFTLPGLTP